MHPKDISIEAYSYHLPDDKIAAFPLAERDASKLLVYKNGHIVEDIYRNLAAHLPEGSLLVFNNTKVIPARILFRKQTGGVIEVFCLEPSEAISEYTVVMNSRGEVRWKCMIGGARKWKGGQLERTINISDTSAVTLKVTLVEKLADAYVAEFSWNPVDKNFAEILALFGDVPLPPYIKRKTEVIDRERYQTIYAEHQGSVAAPTAGLHFTKSVFDALRQKGIASAFVTLHVGAGTFKPVKAETMQGHEMHSEWMDVSIDSINKLIDSAGSIVAVGTTSLRTLESLYWMGIKVMHDPNITQEALMIKQWEVYEPPLQEVTTSAKEALLSLKQWMVQRQLHRMFLPTQILISPGYTYRVAKAIATNFHQPQSTLLLLVAAAVGDDWKAVYQFALDNHFRFLSYGDGSLLFVKQ